MPIPKTKDLFDLSHTVLSHALAETAYPWDVLPHLKDVISEIGETLPRDEYSSPVAGVWIHHTAKVAPTAYIGSPAIICEGAEIRHCAFIRGSAVVGKNAVVGNSTELKNAILFDGVQVPHYNYVGDAVLGYKAHMGAGVVASNVKGDKSLISVKGEDEVIATGLKKFSAILGDYADIGCNSVLCPGTVVGRYSRVYPLSLVRGVVPEKHIYKRKNDIVKIKE